MYRRKTRITKLDVVVTALIVLLAAYIAYRLTMKLNYKWNWSIIPQYLFFFDEGEGRWKANVLIQGLLTTIRLTVWSTLLAMIFGFITGIMRTTPRLFNRLVGRSYVELIRNVPPLVLIFIFYFFVSDQIIPLLGVEDFIRTRGPGAQKVIGFFFSSPDLFTAFLSGMLTVAIFQGAYITEIVRAGIQSLGKGQWEASYALGLSRWQQMRYVILPQAYQRILPPLAGQFISLIKDSSIISLISVQELTFLGTEVAVSTRRVFETWIAVAAMYFLICFTLSRVFARLEARSRTVE